MTCTTTPILQNQPAPTMRLLPVVLLVVAAIALVTCRGESARRPTAPTGEVISTSAWLEGVHIVAIETLQPVEPGIQRAPSGVLTKVIRKGHGSVRVTLDDAVVLFFQVYDSAGRVTARSQDLIGDPAIDLNQAGREVLSMMVEGEVRRIWFPDPKSANQVKVTDYEVVWLSPHK